MESDHKEHERYGLRGLGGGRSFMCSTWSPPLSERLRGGGAGASAAGVRGAPFFLAARRLSESSLGGGTLGFGTLGGLRILGCLRGDPGATVVAGPLVKLAVGRASGRPEYLRALQILPGRIEFSYLPEETQALLILPTAAGAGGGAVIVGADRQRAFGEDAVRRCAAIATEIVGDALC